MVFFFQLGFGEVKALRKVNYEKKNFSRKVCWFY